MPQELDAASTTIKHDGTFDIEKTLSTIRDWMKRNLYGYLEKKQRFASDGRSLTIEGGKAVDEYAKLSLEISLNAENLKAVDIILDQKKIPQHQGKITIKISGKLTLDHAKKLENEPWLSIRTLIHKTLMRHRVGKWFDDIDTDVFALTRSVRDALELEA